jgi:hypothetical protein
MSRPISAATRRAARVRRPRGSHISARFSDRRHRRHRPFGRQRPGLGHDAVVGVALGAEESHDRSYRREPDISIAQAVGVEPVFVKIYALRQLFEDRLVEAGCKQAPDARLCHDRCVTLLTTAAAIVAGGRARRYGGLDKSRLVVEGRPIIVRQVEVLRRIAAPVFVVGGAPDRFDDVGLTVYRIGFRTSAPSVAFTRPSKSPKRIVSSSWRATCRFLMPDCWRDWSSCPMGTTAPGCGRSAGLNRC